MLSGGSPSDAAPLRRAMRYAKAAAALDVTAEVYAVGEGVAWFTRQHAAAADASLRELRELGGRVYVCPAALAESGFARADLLDSVDEIRGAPTLLESALAPDALVMSF